MPEPPGKENHGPRSGRVTVTIADAAPTFHKIPNRDLEQDIENETDPSRQVRWGQEESAVVSTARCSRVTVPGSVMARAR